MTPERWRRIDSILQECLDLPPAARDIFLTSACAGDDDLRGEVEELLAAEEVTPQALASAIAEAAHSVSSPAAEAAGTRIGVYRIVREIGRGGMGVVYQAERDDDEFHKQVAIKKVLRGMDTDFVLGRFRHERQILAGLEHPYIARLIDGGSAADGRPYLVMELVEGEPLLDYASRRNLDLPARLDIFRKVCSAVEHAHRNLVVHRDLKPGNILVTADGSPKLLDFGIAKLVYPGAAPLDATGFLRLMTPEYASPEQVLGAPITTATDVYALGAILYELLTGVRAHRFTTQSPTEIERVVCREEPPRPSFAAKSGARRLAGDLDNIVLKAMRKDPAQRYASAAELSADIGCYLDGQPVLARAPSLSYRAGKFVRRNKAGVFAASAVAASLIAGAYVAAAQARRAERRFNQVRRLANSVLYDIHDAIRDLPGSTRARQTLVNTGLEYLDSLSREAAGDRGLLMDLSAAYQRVGDVQGRVTGASLGNTAAALASYRKALAMAEEARRLGDASETVTARLVDLHAGIGSFLIQSNHKAEALASFQQAVAIGEAVPQDRAGLDLLRHLAGAYHELARNQDNTTDSLATSKKHLAIVERLASADPKSLDLRRELSDGYSNMGVMLERRTDPSGAHDYYRKAVELREKLAAEDPNNTRIQRELAIGYGHLGDVLGNPQRPNLGDRPAAVAQYRAAVRIAESLSRSDPANHRALMDLAIASARLADTLDDQPGAVESMALYRKSNMILDSLMTGDQQNQRLAVNVANNHSRLADCLRTNGQPAAALREYRAAIEQAQKVAAGDPGARRELRDDYLALARLLAGLGDRRGAIDAIDRSVAQSEAIAASDPSNLRAAASRPRSYARAGEIRRGVGDCESAAKWFARSVAAWAPLRPMAGFGAAEEAELAGAQSGLAGCRDSSKK
jgi:tetratricopeptide (TPR) repeat protein